MVYNITNGTGNLTSVDTMIDLLIYADNAVGNILMQLMVISIFIILLLVLLRRTEVDNALAASSFACLFLSLILSYINLLNIRIVFVFGIILALLGLYWTFIKH